MRFKRFYLGWSILFIPLDFREIFNAFNGKHFKEVKVMIWQVALLIVALTFMFVNVWSVILNIKILNKTSPLFDRMLTFSEKWMDQMEEDFED